MKKVLLSLMITALSVFMFAAVCSADGNHWRKLNGSYEMIVSGSCIHSSKGFKKPNEDTEFPKYIPEDDSVVWTATTNANGEFNFEPNGTGTAVIDNFIVDAAPGSPPNFPPSFEGVQEEKARGGPFDFPFTYELTRDRSITVTPDFSNFPLPFLSWDFVLEGKVSVNRKSMTLNSMNQGVLPFVNFPDDLGYTGYCNFTRILIRVGR